MGNFAYLTIGFDEYKNESNSLIAVYELNSMIVLTDLEFENFTKDFKEWREKGNNFFSKAFSNLNNDFT
jgi:hypothetical protein